VKTAENIGAKGFWPGLNQSYYRLTFIFDTVTLAKPQTWLKVTPEWYALRALGLWFNEAPSQEKAPLQ